MTDRCEPEEDSTDDAPAEAVLAALVRCYLHWQPDVRVLGNVRSCDAVRAIREMWARSSPVATPAEVEALRAEVMRAGTECADAMTQVATLRARVAELEGALEPFAVIADEAFTAARDSQTVTDIGMEDEVTVGMLRTARAALSPTPSSEKSE